MHAILTELPKLSSSNIRVCISGRAKDGRRAKAKTDSNVLTIQTDRWFLGKSKGKHTGSGKSGASAHYANLISVEDYNYSNGEDMDESENICRAYDDPVDPGSDDGEGEENDTFSSSVALDDVSVFEAAELDAIALLADIRDNALDPEVSAQLAQAYLSHGEKNGKGKGKSEGQGKGKFPVRPSCLPQEDRRQRLRELKGRTECRPCGRKGHWAHDRECAMSPFSLSSKTQTHTTRMTTQQHLSSQPKKITTCVVLSDFVMVLKH